MNSSLPRNSKPISLNYLNKEKNFEDLKMLELQLELQQKLLTRIKQLEESSSLIESLRSLQKNSKCLNSMLRKIKKK